MALQRFIDKQLSLPLDKDRVLAMSQRAGLKYLYYDDIKPHMTLKSLLPKPESGRLILFTKHDGSQIGHFCLLFRNPRSGYHFFGSYGFGLHKVLEITGSSHKLEKLLRGHNIHINKHQFQHETKGQRAVNTCGRFCITRWNAAHLKPKEFEDLMHHRALSPDEIVTLMTMERDLVKYKP